ncbi:MAG: hypothetical protein ACRDP6_29245 [Actinoallomurus sp.]
MKLGTLLLRFSTGAPLGKPRTDATLWTAGENKVGGDSFWHRAEPTAWAYLPGWQRAVVRWTPFGTAAAWWCWPVATEWTVVVVGAAGLGLWINHLYQALQVRRHRRTIEAPLAVALAPILAVPERSAAAALAIEYGFEDTKGGEPVGYLELPAHFHADADQRNRTEKLFEARLGIECDFRWRTSKTPMHLEITRAPVPPDLVTLAEVRAAMDACDEGQVVLGKDARGRIFYGDFLNEDPHWGISAGSRRGKTTLLCSVAAQLLRQGAERVTGIDPKMISLDALVGVPGCDIHNDPRNVQDMWNAIADFRAHMDERMDAYSKDKTLEFKRSLLIIDEINQFAQMSLDYWRAIKEKKHPAQPPVWRDLAAIAWQGAQLRCNMVVVGQRLDAPSTGGTGLRDSFGIRMLAGFTPQQWGFLVGTYPVPRSQKPRGRFIVINGGDQTWVQLVKVDPEDVRDLAMEPTLGAAGASHADTPTGSIEGDGTREPSPSLPVRHSLKDASANQGKGIVPMNYEALRKKPRTDENFPKGRATPTGTTYTAEELRAWYEAYSGEKINA